MVKIGDRVRVQFPGIDDAYGYVIDIGEHFADVEMDKGGVQSYLFGDLVVINDEK